MKRLLLLLSLVLIFGTVLYADISEYYEFVAGTTNYSDITGTAVTAAQGDDVISGAIDIGFTFNYGTNSYTQIKIASNGYITLGTTPGSTLTNNLTSTTYCPIIAATWDDLHTGRVADATYPQTSSVQYLMQGAAPNRTFTVQYQYAYWYYNASPASWVNFQIVLKENSGIEIKYGPNAGTSPGTSASASIGINMLPGGAGNYLSVNPTALTASSTAETNNINAYIPAGTMFSFNPPLGLLNDLSALNVTGSTTPSAGNATPYTVTVRNRGTVQQTAYTVKLMNGTTELASVPGPTIAPGTNASVVLNWTPTTQGPVQLTGKVILAGDQNTTNDQTPPFSVTVMPSGSIVVTVGDGSQTSYQMPVNMYYKASVYENIYQASEMTAGGMLMAVTFYNNFFTTTLLNKPTKIWLGLTTQTDLSAGWINSTDLTLVFDGTVNYPAGLNDILIPLQTPFPFAGGNLVMMVERPMDTAYYSTSDLFLCQTVGTNRARHIYSDTVIYDPTNMTGGTLTGMFPKTTFTFVSTGTTPQFAVSPQSYNFGQKIINTTSNQNFNVMNVGGGATPLGITSISISGSPFFTLQNMPTLPASLNSGQSTNFTVRYNPTAAGTHTATVTVVDNLARTSHTIPITASCMDPQIYTSPYVQNFNSVTVPSLPLDWSKLEVSPGTVTSSTTAPYSTPNCIYMYNSSATSGPFLIAPPVAPTLPLTTMRVKFWAKGSTTTTLSVGVMSSPTDAATFTQVQSLTLTAAWAEYIVGFQTYMGQGNFITFKHGNSTTYQGIYIDDVTIEVIANNDLAALSVSGNSTPSVGAATNYTVNVFNWGTASQSNYLVKLYDGNNLELASVPGPNIGPGAAAQAILSWTPTTAGPMTIYGKVILAGDANNTNDQSPNLNLVVQPLGTIAVTIGDGSVTSYQMPVNMFYKGSVYQNIYLADEMTAGGILNSIAFYNNFFTTTLQNKPTKIWLGITNLTNLSAGWISSNDMTLVFDGTVNYPAGINVITIPLDTPFPYAGGNLVMMVERPQDTQYFSTSDLFYCQTVGTDHARYIYSDTVIYDPANMTGGTVTGMYPKTTFFFTTTGTTPQFAISPQSYNYGQALINTTANKTFNIMNIGGGILTISSIAISGSPFFTLQNLPTLPISLNTGQTTTFVARYNPTTAGNHTATITITDNMARTQHPVQLTATAVDVTIYSLPYFQNFDSVTTPNLPVDWNKLVTAPGTVTTSTTSPSSTPNSVYIYNSTSTAGPYLIAPPIVSTIPMVTTRVRFKAKGSGYALSVGIMGDPTDAATYTQVQSLTLTSAWADYVVGFQTYAGAGRYIAFKHGNASTSQSIYVDDVMIEVIADNDLAATTLTGNPSPSVGSPFTYTVSVTNWGSLAQSNYQVKLYNSDNLELASAQGVQVNPGLTVDVTVNWTPTTQGAMTIYGKVVLAGDQNNLNDNTPNLGIFVHPQGTLMATIGNGTATQRQPMGSLYGYERDATLYTADQIGLVGAISGVQWYATTQYGNVVPYRILMKTTTATALTATPWLTMINDATLCAEGTITINQLGWMYIPFTIPFVYAGDNLIVLVETNYGGPGTTSTQYFQYTVGSTGCHQYWYADTTPQTTNGYLNTYRPNIGISFTSIGTNPVFAVSPTNYNYGQTFMNIPYNKSFTIVNIGGGPNPLVINSITISGSPFFSLQNLPALPLSLSGFQTSTFTARYLPTAVGNHTATITITDNLNRTYTYGLSRDGRDNLTRTQHPVELSGSCIDPTIYTSPYAQNFDGVTTPNLPIDWSKYIVSPGNVTTVTTTPFSTPNCVLLANSTSTDGPYLISPPISNTLPLNTMRIKFRAKGSTTMSLSVGAMTNPSDASTFVQVSNFMLTSAWAEYTVGMQTYMGTGRFMAIKHGNASTSQSIYVDDVMIEVIPQNDLSALSIAGNTTPSVGMATNYTVNLFNNGTLPQSNYTVKLYTEGNVEVASVAGPNIAPGTAAQAVVTWVPATQGSTYIYGKVVLTGDQNNLNDQTPNLNVLVQGAGTMVVTIGDGSATSYQMPVNMFYKASLYENIYLQSELNFIGMITGIAFYNNFSTNLPNKPTKVWLGTTTQTDLSTGWINSTNMTLVFDGNVDYPTGQNVITIPLNSPFLYLQDNLVMLVERPMDTAYFSTADLFYVQTVGTNHARYIYSDTVIYDPTNITGGTVTGMFPKTSLFVIPGGVGHLTGTVLGAGNAPLANTTVQIVNGGQATTNAQGQYTIMNIVAGTYQVTASRYGYISQTVNVVIPEDSTVTQNFTLQQMPTVNVTGTIVGSDAPTVGLANATITMTGYENYSATANAQGTFTITGVYTNQTYQFMASAVGYQNNTGVVNVGIVPHNMGNIVVNEIAYTPRNIVATQATNQQSVTITWTAPDPNAVDIDQSFESVTFPPTDWTRIITNNGPANTVGVYPTWCRFGTVTSGTTTVVPSSGSWQSGFWWDFNHQDEWLISPQFNCPQGASLSFGSYVFFGSTNGDHYYVKISNNNGNSWNVLWDASTLTGGWNNYQTPINIDLSAYAGQQVKIAWHADDPNTTNDGMWYNWFIDNVVISNAVTSFGFPEESMTMRSGSAEESSLRNIVTSIPMSRDGREIEQITVKTTHQTPAQQRNIRSHSRSLMGYKVWRLTNGQENNESTWTLLTNDMINVLTHTDNSWATLAAGTYKYAIKAIYTNNVLSLGAFSNPVIKNPVVTGTLVGTVRNQNNLPISGATITAGIYTTTTGPNGFYSMAVAAGIHTVTCSATTYNTQTQINVVITADVTTTQNFILTPEENLDVVEVTKTVLNSNYPNPFNPVTTISYDIKAKSPVRIDIYNAKGQLIRTLVNEVIEKGQHHTVWNGKDNHGNAVASGIYHYRMQAGDYKATRRMVLMK